jgi:alkaline phosphatase D
MTRALGILCLALSFPLILVAQTTGTLIDHNSAFSRGTINPDWKPFYHGVASGDPLADRVIIWTRVTPDAPGSGPVEVEWVVSTDVDLSDIVAQGTFITDASRDYTVKVDVSGLSPGTTYYYGFSALGAASLTGRTKTTPTGNQADHLKFGVVSCSNYQAGFFNAYQRLSERNDLDAILHLGDYIYEYADGGYGNDDVIDQRPLTYKEEIITLDQYRTRYSTYRLDTSLARVHQQHPFITVWDDHESANDAYKDGAQNHQPDTEGDWEERKAVSRQAYFEWMPIRDNPQQKIWRTISYGNIADLIMLDTRLEGRDEQILDINDPALYDTARTLLGKEQYDWLTEQLTTSTATWKILGQQVIFSDFNVGWAALQDTASTFSILESLFLDIWDGYPAERRKIIDLIEESEIKNTVILTGDFHSTFAFDVADQPVDLQIQTIPGIGDIPIYAPGSYDPVTGDNSIAVEFATPSVTSANFDENVGFVTALFLQGQINQPIDVPNPPISLGNPNPHMRFTDLIRHGYFVLDIKPDSVQADWYYSDILEITDSESFGEGWRTLNGKSHLQKAQGETAPKAVQDTPAPPNPPFTTSSTTQQKPQSDLVVLGLYPNPFSQTNTLHYALNAPADLRINLSNIDGTFSKVLFEGETPTGLYTLVTDGNELPAGTYFYTISTNGRVMKTLKVILKK